MRDILTANPISPNVNPGPHPSMAISRKGLTKEEQEISKLMVSVHPDPEGDTHFHTTTMHCL